MLGPTNHRRSRRLIVTTLFALVAQGLLVVASPLADIHYHRFGPLEVQSAGSHHLSSTSGPCPECLALQTMAVPGSVPYVLRSTWSWQRLPVTVVRVSRPALRPTNRFARAPPSVPDALL